MLLALLQHNQEGQLLFLFVFSALWQNQLQVIPSDQESSQWWSAESQRGEETSPKMSQMFMQTKIMDSFRLVSLIYFDHLSQVFCFFFFLPGYFLPQVLETISCYPENMEAKELRRILTQPHFMVGRSCKPTRSSLWSPGVEVGLSAELPAAQSCLAPLAELGEPSGGGGHMPRKKRGRSVRAGSGDAVRGFTGWMYISWLSILSCLMGKRLVETIGRMLLTDTETWINAGCHIKVKCHSRLFLIPFLWFSFDEKCLGFLSTQQLNVGC